MHGQEAVKAAHTRDHPGDGARRTPLTHQAADECFELLSSQPLDIALSGCREPSQLDQIARVAFERVVGKTTFVSEMRQIFVDARAHRVSLQRWPMLTSRFVFGSLGATVR